MDDLEKDYYNLYKVLDIKPGNIYQIQSQNIATKINKERFDSSGSRVYYGGKYKLNDIFTVIDLGCHWSDVTEKFYSDIQVLLEGVRYHILGDIVYVNYIFTKLTRIF